MSQVLDEVQLQKLAPSVFATGGSERVSSRYGFIPTIDVVRGLSKAGFHPVMATQSRSRIVGRQNFVKHMMRFRHESNMDNLRKDGMLSEIVLINSHDGTTSYQLRAGIYRLVCKNGLVVGNEFFTRSVKHQGKVVDRVVEAANDLIEVAPISVERVKEWQGIELNHEQKVVYAQAALGLKWDGDETLITPNQALEPRRFADESNDLWTTFNVLQENIIRGGIRYRTEDGSRMRTRAVNSVGENVRLNTALWTLTEKMAELSKK
ncbi:MAG: DUF945 domain-containing protein [Verrucomicrobia bacterium]|nr:MAG: DUF945 domain-containing protein [Verrucomicrobiota bacterium]